MAKTADPLLQRARTDAQKRLRSKSRSAGAYTADELTLLGRLLDEFDRKSRAWRIHGREHVKAKAVASAPAAAAPPVESPAPAVVPSPSPAAVPVFTTMSTIEESHDA